ncbi:MAG: transcription factor E [Methanobrevibacter sp.]|nr:transcription factor E [Methanobrevibacter sp.]
MLNDPLVHKLVSSVVKEEENIPIVKSLIDGTNTDEDIAEETDIKLNVVRKILYRLYDSGLASYKRSKDPETQWYTYSWKFDKDGINDQIKGKAAGMISSLEQQLEIEENNMFFECQDCPKGYSRHTFDKSSEVGFTCPRCGGRLIAEDNQPIIDKIREDIESYQRAHDSL